MKAHIPIQAVVIDDDDRVCRQLAGWLSSARYDVVTFTDPAEGLNHLLAAPSDLALVDLRLPDRDGVDVIASLRAGAPQTRIVAMSAFPDPHQVAEAFAAGARELIEKPLSEPRLLATLERQLQEIGIRARTEREFNTRLGARLRALRKNAGRTQTDVAATSGITAAQLSQIELGKTATSTWTLARICGSLRIPMANLFESL